MDFVCHKIVQRRVEGVVGIISYLFITNLMLSLQVREFLKAVRVSGFSDFSINDLSPHLFMIFAFCLLHHLTFIILYRNSTPQELNIRLISVSGQLHQARNIETVTRNHEHATMPSYVMIVY